MQMFGTAIILAGGGSTRMGFDKQLIRIEGRLLVDRLSEQLSHLFPHIVIVTNKPDQYGDSRYTLTQDIFSGQGPAAGLHAGLLHSQSRLAYLIACDMPNVNIEYIKYMQSLLINSPDFHGVVTRVGGHFEPFNAIYSTTLIPQLEQHLQSPSRGLSSFLRGCNLTTIEEQVARSYSPDWSMFANLNTPRELAAYESSVYFY